MIPLLILSILSLAVIIERIFTYSRRIMPPSHRIEDFKKTAHTRGHSTAASLLQTDRSLAGIILRESLETYQRKGGATTLQKTTENTAEQHMETLTEYLWILRAIGQIAPVIGLLGTVVGLSISFKHISLAGLSQQSVAGGISMALITTIAGLFIALPTLCAEYCFRAWAQRLFKRVRFFLTTAVEWFEAATHAQNS